MGSEKVGGSEDNVLGLYHNVKGGCYTYCLKL